MADVEVEVVSGIRVNDPVELIAQVEKGIAFGKLEALQDELDLPRSIILGILDITKRTLVRRKENGRLKMHESERLVRLARLYGKAVDLFEGDQARASRWLQRENRALGGNTPLDYMKTEPGAREVEALIGRLEHGVFS